MHQVFLLNGPCHVSFHYDFLFAILNDSQDLSCWDFELNSQDRHSCCTRWPTAILCHQPSCPMHKSGDFHVPKFVCSFLDFRRKHLVLLEFFFFCFDNCNTGRNKRQELTSFPVGQCLCKSLMHIKPPLVASKAGAGRIELLGFVP